MKTQGVLTYVEEQPQVDFRLADIEETMNEAEKTEATALTYNFQVIVYDFPTSRGGGPPHRAA